MRELVEQVRAAAASRTTLAVRGHGSKTPVWGEVQGAQRLDTAVAHGIVAYQPSELVVTVLAGTALETLNAALHEAGQCLAFDPPMLGGQGTVGGAIASGLSGPTRPFWGSLRDALLGVRIINGNGELLRFGGEVMKNVAGYDVSRLQAGGLGAFGVIAQASLRVRPLPEADETYAAEVSAAEALMRMRAWCRQPLPLAALAYADGWLYWRLAGHPLAVKRAATAMKGEAADAVFWQKLRDLELPHQREGAPWRRYCPPASGLRPDDELVDWAGGLRWGVSVHLPEGALRLGERPPPVSGTTALQRRVLQAFDPHGLFSTGESLANPAA